MNASIAHARAMKSKKVRTMQAQRVKDDFKLLAKQKCELISHWISEDASTLAKYHDRACATGLATTRTVQLRDGFDASWLEHGQARLLPGSGTSSLQNT